MKNNEKALTKQILTEEEQLAHDSEVREVQEKQLADSIAKLPKGFRFKEERGVDPENPPIIIDIIANLQQVDKIKLSQLFTKIESVRLEPLADSTFYTSEVKFLVNDKYIYGACRNGIVQFNRNGQFIKYICQNENHTTMMGGYEGTTEEDSYRFVGGTQPKIINHKLYYKYENRPENSAELMEVEESSQGQINLPTEQELQTKNLQGLGNKASGSNIREFGTFAPEIYPLGGNLFGHIAARKTLKNETDFITITSKNGDTICSFTDYDRVSNYSKSVYNSSAPGNTYFLHGNIYVRKAYHDTIFQLVPPNRLVPHIVLTLGEQAINPKKMLDPAYDLKGKLILTDFLETNRFLFLTYSKQVSENSKDIRYSRLVYDKQQRQTIVIYIDEAAFVPKVRTTWPSAPNINIENDLDAMPFVWPEFVSADGKPFSKISGEDLLNLNDAELPFKNITKSDQIIAIYH